MLVYNKHLLFNMYGMNIKVIYILHSYVYKNGTVHPCTGTEALYRP